MRSEPWCAQAVELVGVIRSLDGNSVLVVPCAIDVGVVSGVVRLYDVAVTGVVSRVVQLSTKQMCMRTFCTEFFKS